MKQLTCEMCGSTDLMKQDGVFVCQSCGTKYSVEEAKKMMVEGTVDVSGSTVKVDTSGELANLYQIARRAKDDDNRENAAKYYDMILVKDPSSWEAAFYVVYFKAMECKIAQIRSAAISVSNCLDSVLLLIKNNVPQDEQKIAVKEIVSRSSLIARMLASGAKSHYNGISSNIQQNYEQECIDNLCAARDIMYTCGTQIDRIFGDDPGIGKEAANAWKVGIEMHNQFLSYFSYTRKAHEQVIGSYAEKVGKYDQNYWKKYKAAVTEKEIEAIKQIISQTPIEPKWDFAGIFLIGLGAITALFAMSVYYMSEYLWVMAAACIIFGIVIGKPKAGVVEANKKKVEDAQAELQKKQAELDALK